MSLCASLVGAHAVLMMLSRVAARAAECGLSEGRAGAGPRHHTGK